MDITTPIFEEALIYAGQLTCLLAAIYMVKIGQVKLGMLFVIALALQVQVGYVISSDIVVDATTQGECWATGSSYYDCLPIVHRISIHAGQVGTILLGVAIFLSARKLRKQNA